MNDQNKIDAAAEFIGASRLPGTENYVYYASEIGKYYRTDAEELIELYDLLTDPDSEIRTCAYSLWCAHVGSGEGLTWDEAREAGWVERKRRNFICA